MNKNNKQILASAGEKRAAEYLLTCGYTVLCTNFRTRQGEVDIIVEKDQHLVFVEVKTRSFFSVESAAESVNYHKQRRISLAALEYYNQNTRFANYESRFDVIIVLYDRKDDTYNIKHFIDAFLPIL